MTLEQSALRLAIRDRDTYRAIVLAALDQLHAAYRKIDQQQAQIAEMREERTRYARAAFGVTK